MILPSRSPFESLVDQLPMRVPVDEGYPPIKFKTPFVPPAPTAPEKKEGDR